MKYLLLKKKSAILERWFHLIVDSYPSDTSGFLRREKDRFVNPIGYTISREIEVIYDELLTEMHSDKLLASLDSIIRLRSVQEFTPFQAIIFIFQLKSAIRAELGNEIQKNQLYEELLRFESRIDELALLAVDIYTKCREKVYEIRVNEVRIETELLAKLLERTTLMSEKMEKERSVTDKRI